MTKMSKKYRNIAAGIAASLVILLGAGTAYAYNTPVAHISLDVNPAITYSVNAFNRVIHVDKNADAAAILQGIDWEGEDINAVLTETISALKAADFLKNDKWYAEEIVIGVNATSTDKEEQLILAIQEQLTKIVAKETGKEVDKAKVDLDETVVGIGAERVKEVALYNDDHPIDVTPGKYNLVEKLDASFTDLDGSALSEADKVKWLNKTVKEIMVQIKLNRPDSKDKPVEGTEAVSTDDEPKTNDNSNNGIGNGEGNGKVNNNGNGNINNNGNGEGNVNDDVDDDKGTDDLDDDDEDN